ncbi:hypothetical protein [Erysipelatoclostridium sp. DFI.2.3]|nr:MULTISPECIES: hypothetical protein [Thomasclavelia]EQJ59090.1 hypothetical protein QSI_1718 [Clostridioides difficile P28]
MKNDVCFYFRIGFKMPLQRVFCMTNRTAQKAVKVAVGLLLYA